MVKKIGLYGGSFDPIHVGHLNLATEIMEAHHLDEVWFCPTAINPHKTEQDPVSADHRLNMIDLAIENEPRFKISEIEIQREGISYTIDTLNELSEIQKSQDSENPITFALILGEDSARNFHKWHKPEEIVERVSIYTGSRTDFKKNNAGEPFQGSSNIKKALEKGLTKTRLLDISSKEIRERLLNKKYCYHLVPAKVMDYIIANHLYYHPLNEIRFL